MDEKVMTMSLTGSNLPGNPALDSAHAKQNHSLKPPLSYGVSKMRNLRYKSSSGFSLVELVVAVVILSLGILIVYEGFLISLRGFYQCKYYLGTQAWIDEKLWDIGDNLGRYNTFLAEDNAGTFKIGNKKFNWSLSYSLLEQTKEASLYEVRLGVFWEEGKNRVNVKRATYVLYTEKE